MGEEDNGFGLGLSLSLGSFGDNQSSKSSQAQASVSHLAFTKPPYPLNFFKSPNLQYHKPQSHSDAFQAPTAADLSKEPRQLFRGIDVNQSVTVTESEEENPVVSSPNSTVSSLSGKRSEREDRDDGERGSSSLEAEDDGGDAAARKKLRLSKEQAAVLEETFKEHSTLNPKQKMALAKRLDLMPRQVEVWFQNRRARTKLKQTEVDCEYLRRCCENLTEENRRLQKEVSELRALKLSPQLYANMNPPTTLTMCPQCERVACSTTGQPSHHHHQHQRPVAMSPWAAIISPQSLDAPANRRPRT